MTKLFSKELMGGLVILCIFWTISCDHGLAPPKAPTGFGGTVSFRNWPSLDSVKDLRLIAFRNYPPGNIFSEIIFGRAFVYPSIDDTLKLAEWNTDSISYEFLLDENTYDFEYIVVALRYAGASAADSFWRAVGQFDSDTIYTVPNFLHIEENVFIDSINIDVDFQKQLPQPF